MMRWVAVSIFLALSSAALAQPAPQNKPAVQAQIEQMLGSLVIENVSLSEQVKQLQAIIDQMKKQAEDARQNQSPPRGN